MGDTHNNCMLCWLQHFVPASPHYNLIRLFSISRWSPSPTPPHPHGLKRCIHYIAAQCDEFQPDTSVQFPLPYGQGKVASKCSPTTGRAGLQDCETLRLPHCLAQWYSTIFARVPPDVISHKLYTPKVVGVQFKLYTVRNLHQSSTK
jgi:hypothetical protein